MVSNQTNHKFLEICLLPQLNMNSTHSNYKENHKKDVENKIDLLVGTFNPWNARLFIGSWPAVIKYRHCVYNLGVA